MKHIDLRIIPSIFVLSAVLSVGACIKVDELIYIPPVSEKPTEPEEPESTEPTPLHIVSKDYSIGGDQYDSDTLFVHFDRKIIASTIPHYDWVTYYTGYYHPENRKILNDTTLALVFDGHQAKDFGEENEFSFTVTCEDGTETPVKLYMPFYHHLIVANGSISQISLYNDYKEILYLEELSKKLVRMDYLTGEIIREYDLSEHLDGRISYTLNQFNGLIYLWCYKNSLDPFPFIFVVDPDSGEIREALTVPEDPNIEYSLYQQPSEINFTKYGTGLLTLVNKFVTGSSVKVVRTQSDGTLTLENPVVKTSDLYLSFACDFFPVAVSQDGSYLMCYNQSSNYIVFDGETCRLQLGYESSVKKFDMTPNLKDGSWFMREDYQQYILYPDGTTSPKWKHHTDCRGGADFCYTPGFEHLVMVFDNGLFSDKKVTFYDTRTGEVVFRKSLLSGVKSFLTTPDGKYGIMHRNAGEIASRYGSDKVLIYVYDLPDLLSHCRF